LASRVAYNLFPTDLLSLDIKLKKKWYKWQAEHNPLKSLVFAESPSATSSQTIWQPSGDTRL